MRYMQLGESMAVAFSDRASAYSIREGVHI
jgi:hypothetical protein